MLEEIIGIVVTLTAIVSGANVGDHSNSDVQQALLHNPAGRDIQHLQRAGQAGSKSICRSSISFLLLFFSQFLLKALFTSYPYLALTMRYSGIAASASALMAGVASAAVTGVTGKPEGFASSTTGGGDTAAVYPSTTDELVSYLGDESARVIVLTKTFDFRGTEGTTTSSGCAPCELITAIVYLAMTNRTLTWY
jgi:hypothetical protein